jgi:hypothetical protein
MAPEPISMAYFINPSHQSTRMCIPLFIARQVLGKHVPAATNTCNTRRTVERVCLCIPLSLLDNNSVKTFPRQRRIVGGVVFCAIRVVYFSSPTTNIFT